MKLWFACQIARCGDRVNQRILLDSNLVPAYTVAIPLWIAGLYFFFAKPEGKRYHVLGWANGLHYAGLTAALGLGIAFMLPIAPLGSRWFQESRKINDDLREEVGGRRWSKILRRFATHCLQTSVPGLVSRAIMARREPSIFTERSTACPRL